jgi:monofunctional glycosyltransferase
MATLSAFDPEPAPAPAPPGKRRSGWTRPLRWLLWFIIGSIAWVLLYAVVPPPVTLTMVLDGNGITKDWMSIDEIDRDMVRAVIAAEDGKFCSHDGFDLEALEKVKQRIEKGRKPKGGGSTISQQTAKNAFLWQGSGWTRYVRKVPEIWFTFLIETLWSKERIMEVYLNVAETGIGTYGVNAGAERYFGKSAASLSPAEAARIAAILPLPKKREAISPGGWTRRYGNLIQGRMRQVRRDGLDACVYR